MWHWRQSVAEFRATLERLCALAEISPAFDDIWGKRNEVPDASLVALLAELGIDAVDEGRAVEAERRLLAARSDERLPPVIVVAAVVRCAGRSSWNQANATAAACRSTHRPSRPASHSPRATTG
jgi:hypothetical protein